MSQLLQRKPIASLLSEAEQGPALKRVMGAGDLVMLAIGAVIGAGIFSSIGTAAAGETLPSGEVGRAGARPVLPPPRPGLRARGAVLRGARRDDPAGGQRLRVLVCHAR